ncbi:hypothetical protein V8F20_007535 [Naviculisporaceae sp. PSN 640]
MSSAGNMGTGAYYGPSGSLNMGPPSVQEQIEQAQASRAHFEIPNPPLQLGNAGGDLDIQAVHAEDAERLRSYQQALLDETLEQCARCKRKWFNLRLRNGVCGTCSPVRVPCLREVEVDRGRRNIQLGSVFVCLDAPAIAGMRPEVNARVQLGSRIRMPRRSGNRKDEARGERKDITGQLYSYA